ncbi:hypothetical protein X798_04885 [Onchocerca flexuosa]|uniref:TMC domain-containing protein n=3 Tax=Onchocerca flexuosa TaxID=387005 RepID=A0A238BSW5_9BILA|nr:hypothetical protein X798_04885 [Onchocerca flexuosa]
MNTENRRSDGSAIIPPALLARPSVRRGSVFSDLLTVFRRHNSHSNRLFRQLSHSSTSKLKKKKKQEGETSLSPTTCTNDQSQEEESDENGKPMSRQVLLDKIREKKEVIGTLRCQPWNMNRKRRTLRLAQKYVAQHELRVSKTNLLKVTLKKKWCAFCRWADNVKIYLIPWESKIKRIESHFGSVVSSYFTFLRWIVYVNLMITLIIVSFIVIPEMLADAAADPSRVNRTASRKIIPPRELKHADELQVVSNFDVLSYLFFYLPLVLRIDARPFESFSFAEGYLKYSPLFYGYYSNDEFVGGRIRYAVPLAYFLITLFVFGYSCFAILRKMAMNARLSKLSDNKTDQYIFSWKLFGGWDYTIGNSETASNTAMAIVIKLRESIVECRVDSVKKFKPLLFLARVIANAIILSMLAFSIYTISFAVQISETVETTGSLFTKNQVPTIIATITNVFPMIFDLVGQIERYHPRTALRAHLTRVLVLYVLNYITFILALFEKLDKIRDDELMKIINEQNAMFHRDDQNSTSAKFHSRNFANTKQADMFAKRALERFSNFYQKSFQIDEKMRRKRKISSTKPPSKFPSGITVESHYGPIGLNNPSALLANKTYPWDPRRFQAIRIGPPSLPTFPIHPLPSNPAINTSIFTELGPHWQMQPKWQPSTSIIPTTATKTNQTSPQNPSKIFPKTTRFPWSSKRKPKLIKLPKMTTSAPHSKAINLTRKNDVIASAKSGKKNIALSNRTENDTVLTIAEDQMTEGIPKRKNLLNGSKKITATDGYFKAPDDAFDNEKPYKKGQKMRMTVEDAEMENNFCWETMVGQPEYGEFKVAENVLHIINNQGMVWLGLFFAPLLPALNNIKLIILMYIRGWACMTCNVPAREIFRASRGYARFYNVLTQMLEGRLDRKVMGWLRYIASPGVVIPVLLLLMLIIYFLVSLVRGLRKRNNDLQQQLIHERTEEKKKIFELAGSAQKKFRQKNQEKKKQITYLPLIEQKRREPWRFYNGQDRNSSLCVTDETSGMTTPDSGQSLSPKKRQLLPQKPIQKESVKIVEPVQPQIIKDLELKTDRANEWFDHDDEEDSELQSYNAESDVVEEATSEEVSNLVRRLTTSMRSSAVSLMVPSKDGVSGRTSPVTVLFSTSSARRSGSRSPANQYHSSSPLVHDSFLNSPSLTQLAQHEPKTNKVVPFSKQSYVSPTHQSLSNNKIHVLISQLHLPSVISKTGSATADPQIPRIVDTQTKKSKPSHFSNRLRTNSSKDMTHEFAPWPSLQEINPQVTGFPHSQQKPATDDYPSKSKSPHQSPMKIENFEDSSTSRQHQRRFRISVSPSRRFQTQSGPSGSDTDTSTGKRRYVIRQEVLPDSTISIDMGDNGTSEYRKL